MDKSGRLLLGLVLAGVSALLFLSAAKVALSARTGRSGSESFQPQVDSTLKQKLFHTTPTSQPTREHASLTQEDFDRIFHEDLVAVVSPAGSSAEEVLATILENRTLPRHIRAPFVALARAKAPHLVTTEDATQF